ncbi:hypothetical protein, partial [Selenomonas sp.]|uniref:hypothetical protein n=1 Tax=Selenomonas sp. TaxID=2053611 RepID=UPI002A7EF5AD
CLLYAQSASACGFRHKMPRNSRMRQSCSFEKLRKTEYERVNGSLYRERLWMDYDAFLSFHGVTFGLMEGTDGLLIVKTGSGGSIYGRNIKRVALPAVDHDFSNAIDEYPRMGFCCLSPSRDTVSVFCLGKDIICG